MKKGSEDIRTLAVRNVLEKKYTIPQVAELTGYSGSSLYQVGKAKFSFAPRR